MSYKLVEEFSHSDLASDPDNQNKEKVCIYVGIDEKGNRLYDLHERRVRTGDIKTLHRIFQNSEFGARFREATLASALELAHSNATEVPVGPQWASPLGGSLGQRRWWKRWPGEARARGTAAPHI